MSEDPNQDPTTSNERAEIVAAFAEKITGHEYPFSEVAEFGPEAKRLGLVIAYGVSDNMLEFDGVIREELGGPTTVHVGPSGLVVNECGECCPYFMQSGTPLTLIWNDAPPGDPWTIETAIPHSKFEIVEDGETFSQGIVFALADVKGAK